MAQNRGFGRLLSGLRGGAWVGPLLLSGSALCLIIFIFLIADAVQDQQKPLISLLTLPAIGIVALAAALVVGWQPGQQKLHEHVLSTKGASTIALAALQAIGAVTTVMGLYDPREAVESRPGVIEDNTTDTREKVDELTRILRNRFPEDPPILTEILGRWGEQDTCAVVWDIAIIQRGEQAALAAEIVARPEGVEPFRLLAEISDAEGYTLDIIGEEPASARGSAAVFTLNPATQRLVWDDKASAGGVEEYVRCPAS